MEENFDRYLPLQRTLKRNNKKSVAHSHKDAPKPNGVGCYPTSTSNPY